MVLLSIAAAAAADKDKPRFAPGPASSFPGHETLEKVTIAAVPYVSDAATRTAFDKLNPNKYGVFPVLVILENATGGTLRLDLEAEARPVLHKKARRIVDGVLHNRAANGIGGQLAADTVSKLRIITSPVAYPVGNDVFVAFQGPGAHCPEPGGGHELTVHLDLPLLPVAYPRAEPATAAATLAPPALAPPVPIGPSTGSNCKKPYCR
jgi:hypothetical protein